jgi:hypothetical protein
MARPVCILTPSAPRHSGWTFAFTTVDLRRCEKITERSKTEKAPIGDQQLANANFSGF